MSDQLEDKITLQTPVSSDLHHRLIIAAAELGISRQEFNRQALSHALLCASFNEGMAKVYADKKVKS